MICSRIKCLEPFWSDPVVPTGSGKALGDHMFKRGIEGLPYYLGVRSLAEIATREDRVCVLNILGGESRQGTPAFHAFSGGNLAFGTSVGRGGQALRTQLGDVP